MVKPLACGSLPRRQLRNSILIVLLHWWRSLPRRQLRNTHIAMDAGDFSSLPRRQLRNQVVVGTC